MTDIDITAATDAALWSWIESVTVGVTRENVSQETVDRNRHRMEAAIAAALPHILAQVEARVKPDRLDVMPTRDEIARIIWTAMEGGETEGRTDGPLDWDYDAANAVLALFNGKTEQEVRRAAYDDLIAELLSVTEDYASIAALSGIVDGLLARGGDVR